MNNVFVIFVDFSDREILVYSVGSAGFCILIVCVCVAFVCIYKVKTKILKGNNTEASHGIHGQNLNPGDVELDSLYDSIDEDSIYDDNIQVWYSDENTGKDRYQKSESDSYCRKSETSSYLHPYATLNKMDERHVYCTNISAYDNSSSSESDIVKRNSEYTHIYQQPQHKEMTDNNSEYNKLFQDRDLSSVDSTKIVFKQPEQPGLQTEHTHNPISGNMLDIKLSIQCVNNRDIPVKSGFVKKRWNSFDKLTLSSTKRRFLEENNNINHEINNRVKHFSA